MLTSRQRIFRYADSLSWILNTVSLAASIGSGAAMPLMTIVFGNSISQLNNYGAESSSRNKLEEQIQGYVYVNVFIGGGCKLR